MVWGLGFSVRDHAFVFRIYGLGPREEAEGAGGFDRRELHRLVEAVCHRILLVQLPEG